MFTFNLIRYFSCNLISLFGYFIFLFYIHYILVYHPDAVIINDEIVEKYGENLLSGLYEGFCFLLYLVILLLLLFFLVIEFFIRKKLNNDIKSKKSNSKNKFYFNLLWFGIICSIIPLLQFFSILLYVFIIRPIILIFQ